MSWPVFLLASLLAVALDGSFVQVLRVGDASPSLLMMVSVYVLLNAPKQTAFRGVLIAGLFADLLSPIFTGANAQVLVVVGPSILGFALGAVALLALRNLLYRKSRLALAFGAAVFTLLAALGTTAVFILRAAMTGTGPWGEGTATGYLFERIACAGVTVLLVAILLPVLDRTRALWSFESSSRLVGGTAR